MKENNINNLSHLRIDETDVFSFIFIGQFFLKYFFTQWKDGFQVSCSLVLIFLIVHKLFKLSKIKFRRNEGALDEFKRQFGYSHFFLLMIVIDIFDSLEKTSWEATNLMVFQVLTFTTIGVVLASFAVSLFKIVSAKPG